MYTIKDLIKSLENFSTNHTQINTYRYGFDDISTTEDIIYPLMYVKINKNVSVGVESTYKLSISLLDSSKTDDRNSLDIISQMNMIGNDVVSYFLDDLYFSADERNVTAIPLYNVQDDNCDGMRFEIDFISIKSLNKCIIPINPEPLVVSITANKVDERIEEPYLTDLNITVNGGTPPYTLNSNLSFQYSGETVGVGNYDYSTGEAVVLNDNEFTIENTYSYNPNYPHFVVPIIYPFVIGEEFIITFDYEILTGNIPFNINVTSGVWNASNVRTITETSGSFKIVNVVPAPTTGLNRIAFRISTDFTDVKKIKISNLKIYQTEHNFDLEMKTDTIDLVQGINSKDYTVTDSIDNTDTKNNTFDVPTPDMNMWIKPWETQTYISLQTSIVDANTKVLIYYKLGGIYINWGDGSPLEYNTTTTSGGLEHIIRFHKYEDTTKQYSIDVYGDGVNGYYIGGVGSNPTVFDKKWVNSFDRRFYQLAFYTGTFISPIDSIINKPERWLSSYNSWSEGDITLCSDMERIYDVSLKYYTDIDYRYMPGLFGDVGTFLKGNWSGNYYEKYANYFYCSNLTYQDRIDAPIFINVYLYIRGYSTSSIYWNLKDPNEVAQLIVDIETWRYGTTTATLNFTGNASPNNADEPLKTEFIAAKAALVADGWLVSHN